MVRPISSPADLAQALATARAAALERAAQVADAMCHTLVLEAEGAPPTDQGSYNARIDVADRIAELIRALPGASACDLRSAHLQAGDGAAAVAE